MTEEAERLRRLARIAAIQRDARLDQLRRAQAARQASLSALAALDLPMTEEELPLVPGALAALRYAGWADARRAEINLRLARQTALWLQAQADARLAFGRADVLRRLSDG